MLLLMHLIKPGTIEESKTYIRRVTTRQVTLVSLQKSDGIVVFNSVSIFFFLRPLVTSEFEARLALFTKSKGIAKLQVASSSRLILKI